MVDYKTNQPDLINRNESLDELSGYVHYWSPSVEHQSIKPFYPSKKKTNSSLRIASITGERLFHGLRFEAELFILTPQNWEHIFSYLDLDLILIESCRKSITGEFHLAQLDPDQDSTIVAIIKAAKKKGVPTVFWNTHDHVYHEHYKDISKYFDFIFCADPKSVGLLEQCGLKADTLLPAVQPAIFNPFSHYSRKSIFEIGVLFDGLADLFRFENDLPILKEILTGYGLRIIDSNSLIFKNRIEGLPDFRDNILGCVNYQEKVTALRHSLLSIFFDLSLTTPTTQSWMVLESLACKVVVHHFGSLDKDDIRFDLVRNSTSKISCLVDLANLLEDSHHRKKLAHIGWRKVNSKHTFSHRIKQICEKIQIKHDWQEHPEISVISPSYRPEMLQNSINNFSQQDYPNKELIVVYNGNDAMEDWLSEINTSSEVDVILTQPSDMFAGASLNMGVNRASGEYYFRIDDDDYYGRQYLSDMMLYIRALDIDILGKPPGYWKSEGDGTCYCRRTDIVEHCKLPAQDVIDERLRITGNTFCGNRKSLKNIQWQDNVFGAADSGFLIKSGRLNLDIYCCDINNVVVSRREDEKTHSWTASSDRLKKNSQYLPGASVESLLNLEQQDKKKKLSTNLDRKKRILFLGPNQFKNGVWQTRAEYILSDLFEPIFHEADLYLLTGPVPDFAIEVIDNLKTRYKIHHYALSENGKGDERQWLVEASQYGLEIQPDIVTNIFGVVIFGFVGAKVAVTVDARFIQRVAGDEISTRIALGRYASGSKEHVRDLRKEMVSYNGAHTIITMSPWEQRRVQNLCIEKKKVEICFQGIDLCKFSPPKKDVSTKITKFLFVGSKAKEKGYDLIESAAKGLETDFPDLEFVFAGNFTSGKEGNRTYFDLVESNKLPELYKTVDAFVSSSRVEGMPQVVMEAMAMGIPCIVSRHLFESMLTDGEEVLFTDLDSDDLANQIVRLHTEKSLGKNLAKRSREYAEKHFSKEHCRHIYKKILLGVN